MTPRGVTPCLREAAADAFLLIFPANYSRRALRADTMNVAPVLLLEYGWVPLALLGGAVAAAAIGVLIAVYRFR